MGNEYWANQGSPGAITKTPSASGDPSSIVLLTEYKNLDAFMECQKLFDSMRERPRWQTGGVIKLWALEDLFEMLNTQVFVEESDTSTGLKRLTKQ